MPWLHPPCYPGWYKLVQMVRPVEATEELAGFSKYGVEQGEYWQIPGALTLGGIGGNSTIRFSSTP